MHDTITLHYVTLYYIAWYHTLGLCPIDLYACIVRITLITLCCITFVYVVVLYSLLHHVGMCFTITDNLLLKVQMLRRRRRSRAISLRKPLDQMETSCAPSRKRTKHPSSARMSLWPTTFPYHARARIYISIQGGSGSGTLRIWGPPRAPDLVPRDLLPYLHDHVLYVTRHKMIGEIRWNTTLCITLHCIALHYTIM